MNEKLGMRSRSEMKSSEFMSHHDYVSSSHLSGSRGYMISSSTTTRKLRESASLNRSTSNDRSYLVRYPGKENRGRGSKANSTRRRTKKVKKLSNRVRPAAMKKMGMTDTTAGTGNAKKLNLTQGTVTQSDGDGRADLLMTQPLPSDEKGNGFRTDSKKVAKKVNFKDVHLDVENEKKGLTAGQETTSRDKNEIENGKGEKSGAKNSQEVKGDASKEKDDRSPKNQPADSGSNNKATNPQSSAEKVPSNRAGSKEHTPEKKQPKNPTQSSVGLYNSEQSESHGTSLMEQIEDINRPSSEYLTGDRSRLGLPGNQKLPPPTNEDDNQNPFSFGKAAPKQSQTKTEKSPVPQKSDSNTVKTIQPRDITISKYGASNGQDPFLEPKRIKVSKFGASDGRDPFLEPVGKKVVKSEQNFDDIFEGPGGNQNDDLDDFFDNIGTGKGAKMKSNQSKLESRQAALAQSPPPLEDFSGKGSPAGDIYRNSSGLDTMNLSSGVRYDRTENMNSGGILISDFSANNIRIE